MANKQNWHQNRAGLSDSWAHAPNSWLSVWRPLPTPTDTWAPPRQRTHHSATGAWHTRKLPNVCWTSEANSEWGLQWMLMAKHLQSGLPWCSAGKESTCNAGDPGSIPGSGRSSGESKGYPLQYSWASLVAQLVKNPPAMQETPAQSLGQEDPLEKGMATHSSILAWRIPWAVQTMGSQKVGHDWATFTWASLVTQLVKNLPVMQKTQVHSTSQEDPMEKEMATYSSTLAWKIPWTEEQDRLQSMDSQSWTWLCNFHIQLTLEL